MTTINPDLLRPGAFVEAIQRENGHPRRAYIVRLTRSGRPVARLDSYTRHRGGWWSKPITLLDQDFEIDRALDADEIESVIESHGDPAALDA